MYPIRAAAALTLALSLLHPSPALGDPSPLDALGPDAARVRLVSTDRAQRLGAVSWLRARALSPGSPLPE
ncbi:MAG: hypothetical protein R3A52_23670, partial [Polyangiales bacterium]